MQNKHALSLNTFTLLTKATGQSMEDTVKQLLAWKNHQCLFFVLY